MKLKELNVKNKVVFQGRDIIVYHGIFIIHRDNENGSNHIDAMLHQCYILQFRFTQYIFFIY